MDTEKFCRMVGLGAYAVSKSESRQTLMNVLMTPERMVSSDGSRLAVAGDIDVEGGVLVPAHALQAAARAVGGSESMMVTFDDNRVQFEAGDVRVTSLLVFGQYPDFRASIPSGFDAAFTMSRPALLNAVNLAMMFAKSESSIIRHALNSEGLTVTGVADGGNDGVTLFPVVGDENVAKVVITSPGDFEWLINGVYLQQALKAFQCEDVVVELTDKKCVLLRGDALAVIAVMSVH
jgi:DNA polymerase III sliding clamp (beta) subunit (PCNA family)